jgi:hypothetical protein
MRRGVKAPFGSSQAQAFVGPQPGGLRIRLQQCPVRGGKRPPLVGGEPGGRARIGDQARKDVGQRTGGGKRDAGIDWAGIDWAGVSLERTRRPGCGR